jgi:glucosamine-phosphate N-acetyltransferase
LFNPVKLPPSYTIRPLRRDDYHRGFIELLSQLSVVGDCAEETFQSNVYTWGMGKKNRDEFTRFLERFDVLKQVGTSFIIVMEQDDGRVVASATLLLEHKFLHDCGNVGHIEDVVVHDSQRGKSLGKR